MEPRPSRPSRPSQPYISTGAAPGQPAGTPAYGPGGSFGAPGPFDASSAPPAAPPQIGYDPAYSPGNPLTPIDSGRGSRILAPLLAVAALAVIVASVAWAIGRARGDDDGDGTTAANLNPPATETSTAAAGGSAGGEPTAPSTTAPEGADTAAPTEAPDAEDAAEPTLTDTQAEGTRRAAAEDTPTVRASRERDDARSWLPLTAEVGEGYKETDEQRRDVAEVAGAFPDAEDAEAKLQEWGWLENTYREYQLDDGDPAATTVFNISVHRFETAAGAKEALPYFQDGARGTGVEEATGLPDSGDQIRALEGPTAEGGRIFVVYVREGGVLIRVAGTSLEGDPRKDVLALVDRILAE